MERDVVAPTAKVPSTVGVVNLLALIVAGKISFLQQAQERTTLLLQSSRAEILHACLSNLFWEKLGIQDISMKRDTDMGQKRCGV
jgi:hypothetical protein